MSAARICDNCGKAETYASSNSFSDWFIIKGERIDKDLCSAQCVVQTFSPVLDGIPETDGKFFGRKK